MLSGACPCAWMIRPWSPGKPAGHQSCLWRTRKSGVFWGRWVSSMSRRRAWCQSRLKELFQGFTVGEVEHLFEEVDPEDGLHRPIGTAVVHAVLGAKRSCARDPRLENLGPTSVQARLLARTRNWDWSTGPGDILPSLGGSSAPTWAQHLGTGGEGTLRTDAVSLSGMQGATGDRRRPAGMPAARGPAHRLRSGHQRDDCGTPSVASGPPGGSCGAASHAATRRCVAPLSPCSPSTGVPQVARQGLQVRQGGDLRTEEPKRWHPVRFHRPGPLWRCNHPRVGSDTERTFTSVRSLTGTRSSLILGQGPTGLACCPGVALRIGATPAYSWWTGGRRRSTVAPAEREF